MKRARQEKHRQAALSVSAREVGLSRFVTEGTAGLVGRVEHIAPARRMAQAMAAAAAAALLTAGCAAPGGSAGSGATGWLTSLTSAAQPSLTERPPIIFVHGNGDGAANWLTTLWRFESNGWPRERLHAIDAPNPLSRDDDAVAQPDRTSAAEHAAYLASEIDAVLKRTGAQQVVLVGNSRGGNAMRTYVRDYGAAKVSHAVLGGTPNHGVWARADFRPGNEFNGAGPVLTRLNTPQGPQGLEVSPGLKWMTLRSDANDKFAVPTGEWIGQGPSFKTNVDARGPELKGADNRVLPGLDHREVSYHQKAFEQTWQFITGGLPARGIEPQAQVVLDGKVTGLAGSAPTNLPMAGARVQVHAVNCENGERRGAALIDRTIAADGRWGPLRTDAQTCLEFEYGAAGFATVHQYRAPFPRSSDIVNLRPIRMSDADRKAGALVSLTRPRGYFGLGRDEMSLDGAPLPGVVAGVAGQSLSRLSLPSAEPRTVIARFNTERIAMRTWPAAQGHLSVAEVHQ
jgi:triacylglycerol lipase